MQQPKGGLSLTDSIEENVYTRKRVGGDIINYDAIKIGIISV